MDLFPSSSWDVDYSCENLNKQLFGSASSKKHKKSTGEIGRNGSPGQKLVTTASATPQKMIDMKKELMTELNGRIATKRKQNESSSSTANDTSFPEKKKIKKRVQFKPEEENTLHIYSLKAKKPKKEKKTKVGKLDHEPIRSEKQQKKFSMLLLANVNKKKKKKIDCNGDSSERERTNLNSSISVEKELPRLNKKLKKSKKCPEMQVPVSSSQVELNEPGQSSNQQPKLKKSSVKPVRDVSSSKIITDNSVNDLNVNSHKKKKLKKVFNKMSKGKSSSTEPSTTVLNSPQEESRPEHQPIKLSPQTQVSAGNQDHRDEIFSPRRKQPGSLRERMMRKLQASRFRYLNEQMYCSKGKEALDYFKKDPAAFQAYHKGYRQQVAQWPLNPVDKIINALRNKPQNLVIADFGCGDAKIARTLPNTVHSFDLVAVSDHVTACDMAHTPLGKATVDIAVFCLSLMGTNLADYLVEANRVLKPGGILKIAEVESRFENIDVFIKSLQRYGFKIINKDFSNNLFYFMDLQKIDGMKKKSKIALPAVELKPCLYKKR